MKQEKTKEQLKDRIFWLVLIFRVVILIFLIITIITKVQIDKINTNFTQCQNILVTLNQKYLNSLDCVKVINNNGIGIPYPFVNLTEEQAFCITKLYIASQNQTK